MARRKPGRTPPTPATPVPEVTKSTGYALEQTLRLGELKEGETKVVEVYKTAPPSGANTIPPERRTIPLTLKEAARLMGYEGEKAAEQLRAAMKAMAVGYKRLTRQRYVFDRAEFPAESQSQIIPKSQS
jgi:hypothetical protein